MIAPGGFPPFAPVEGKIESGRHQDEITECKEPVLCYGSEDERLDQVEYGDKEEP